MKDNHDGPTFTRREVIKLGAAGGAAFYLSTRFGGVPRLFAQAAGPLTLDPTTVPQFVTPLLIPPAMPRTARLKMPGNRQADYYEIAVRQFDQQVLSTVDINGNLLPPTTVWSYGTVNPAGTFHYPAFSIEAKVNKPVRVKWINDLKDASGNYLQHLLPVDPTLHWANPPGGIAGRDMRPPLESTPVRIVNGRPDCPCVTPESCQPPST